MLFGPSKKEIWHKLAEELNGRFSRTGLMGVPRVDVDVGPWTVTLDSRVRHAGKTHIPYTRMRACFVNPDGFRFRTYRQGVFSRLGRLLGVQDIEIGHAELDDAFIIQGNDPRMVTQLLAPVRIRRLVAAQPRICLEVRDDQGWFKERFPAGVDMLHFEARGTIKDPTQLRGLFDLFAAVLDRLCELGVATRADPAVKC